MLPLHFAICLLLLVTAKYISNMSCPSDTITFAGTYTDIKVFEFYPKEFIQESRIKCWPATQQWIFFNVFVFLI